MLRSAAVPRRPTVALLLLVLAAGGVPLALPAPAGAAPGTPVAAAGLSSAPPPRSVTFRDTAPAPAAPVPGLPDASARALASAPPLSVWEVRFSGTVGDAATTARAKAAFLDAVATWSRAVISSVPIRVEVRFEPTAPGVLGSTGPAWLYRDPEMGDGRSYYPSALADALWGSDVSQLVAGAPAADIDVSMSSNAAAVYYGTDGRPPLGHVDFETVALHELAHGLGVVGTLEVDDAGRGALWPGGYVYDTFPRTAGGRLVDLPSASLALGAAATSGALTWGGSEAVAASGGPVHLFAPATFEPGSSFSHLDERRYPRGSADALLTPYISAGEVLTEPGPVSLGVLRDLGWRTPPAARGGADSPIEARYAGDPALRALLGEPVGTEQADGDVHWQAYRRGRLYSSPATGVHALQGALLSVFLATGEHRVHGVPVSDERGTADRVGRYNDFSRGNTLFWTPTGGVYPLLGAIHGAWRASGREAGALGYPRGAERPTADGAGRVVDFTGGGSVYWSPATGAHAVFGAIRARWLAEGGPTGFHGYPVTGETGTARGARFNDFSRGTSLYWEANSGVRAVYGAIRERWLAQGGAAVLGHPVTDEQDNGSGGRFNDFAAGATVVWSPGTGAHELRGAIRQAWLGLGGAGGLLGYPTTSEQAAPDGAGRFNEFARGATVYWSPATGNRAVYGAIWQHWTQLGGLRSWLGHPVSDEYAVPGGRRSDFRGGSVTWTPATGPVAVRR